MAPTEARTEQAEDQLAELLAEAAGAALTHATEGLYLLTLALQEDAEAAPHIVANRAALAQAHATMGLAAEVRALRLALGMLL